MKRISKEVKAIADAHLIAKAEGKFDDVIVRDKSELLEALWSGKTFSHLMLEIEIRFCSVTSVALTIISDGKYQSNSYKANIYKGFKKLLQTK